MDEVTYLLELYPKDLFILKLMTGPKVLSSMLAATGIAGLDAILGGGLPRDRLYLIDGDPAPERRRWRCSS